MKKFLIFIFFTIYLTASDTYNFTEDEKKYLENKKVLTVHTEPSWIPFSFLNNQKKPDGYMLDLKKLIEIRTGLKLNIKLSSYDDAIKNTIENKIDLMVDMPLIDSTKDKVLFSKNSTLYYLEGIISQKAYDSINDFKGKKLGHIAGYTYKNYPGVEFISYSDDKTLILDVASGKIDGAIDSFVTLDYLIKELSLNNLHLRHIPNHKGVYYHIATSKENKVLFNILEKVITKKDIDTLKAKWGLISSRFDKSYELTDTELEYLQRKKEFNVCTRFNHYPLSGESNGEITGFSGDLFKILSDKLDIKFHAIGSYSDKEFRDNVLSNKCELVSTLKQDYKGFDNITTTKRSINSLNFVSIGHIEHLFIEDRNHFKNHTIYVLKKLHKDILQKKLPTANIQVIESQDEIMQRVMKDDDSEYVTLDLLAHYIIDKYGFDQYKVVHLFSNIKAKGAIGINTQLAPQMVSILDKTLQEIR